MGLAKEMPGPVHQPGLPDRRGVCCHSAGRCHLRHHHHAGDAAAAVFMLLCPPPAYSVVAAFADVFYCLRGLFHLVGHSEERIPLFTLSDPVHSEALVTSKRIFDPLNAQ